MQAKVGVGRADANHGDRPVVDAFAAQNAFSVANIADFELITVGTEELDSPFLAIQHGIVDAGLRFAVEPDPHLKAVFGREGVAHPFPDKGGRAARRGNLDRNGVKQAENPAGQVRRGRRGDDASRDRLNRHTGGCCRRSG